MKCEYCEGNKFIYDSMKLGTKNDSYCGIDVYINNNKLNIDASTDTYEPNYIEVEVEINYCPMCGRKLIVESDEDE